MGRERRIRGGGGARRLPRQCGQRRRYQRERKNMTMKTE
jgi:hypothetical protein